MHNYLDTNALLAGAFMIFFFLALGVLMVLWIILPFAVFGIKDLIRKATEEQKETNRLLRSIIESRRSSDKEKQETSEEKGVTGPDPRY